ncbi:hypothetical protein DGWBC_1229 [Dehalogenimonas sp. WBC-2]|nr:hypothetical protein DGWBC_1229 [Dehalogenimonas sp. WBC-2]
MDRTIIAIRIQPGSAQTIVAGRYGDAIKIKVSAAPERGKANAALIAFLSQQLGVSKDAIDILRGHTSRNKTIAIEGVEEAEVIKRLLRED